MEMEVEEGANPKDNQRVERMGRIFVIFCFPVDCVSQAAAVPLSSNFSASVHSSISSGGFLLFLKKKRPLVVNLSNPISRAASVIDALRIHEGDGRI